MGCMGPSKTTDEEIDMVLNYVLNALKSEGIFCDEIPSFINDVIGLHLHNNMIAHRQDAIDKLREGIAAVLQQDAYEKF